MHLKKLRNSRSKLMRPWSNLPNPNSLMINPWVHRAAERVEETRHRQKRRDHHTHLLFQSSGRSKLGLCNNFTFSNLEEYSNQCFICLNTEREQTFASTTPTDSNGGDAGTYLPSTSPKKRTYLHSLVTTGLSPPKTRSIRSIKS